MASSHPAVVDGARAAIEPLLDSAPRRIVVGIAGPPAAGKSTLAASIASALCGAHGARTAMAVGMDGFHLANSELSRLGYAARKGAPETFDVYGFIAMLRRLRAHEDPVVYAPVYSRTVHESINAAIPIASDIRVVIVEGNYLLLPTRAVGPGAAASRCRALPRCADRRTGRLADPPAAIPWARPLGRTRLGALE